MSRKDRRNTCRAQNEGHKKVGREGEQKGGTTEGGREGRKEKKGMEGGWKRDWKEGRKGRKERWREGGGKSGGGEGRSVGGRKERQRGKRDLLSQTWKGSSRNRGGILLILAVGTVPVSP